MDRSISRRSRRRIPPAMESLEGRALLSVVSQLPDAVDQPVKAVAPTSEPTPADDQTVRILSAPAEGTPSEVPPAHAVSTTSLTTLSSEDPTFHPASAPIGGAPSDDPSVHLLAATSGETSTDDQAARLLAASSGAASTDDQAMRMLAASSGGASSDDQTVRLLAASSEGTASNDPPVHLISATSERIVLDGTVRGKVRPWQGATIGAQAAYVLSGVGQHATLGNARVDGFLMPTSVESNPSATLTLKTARGNVTLALEALPETSARPALAYRYTLQKGTGAYRNATASGTATLSLPQGLPRAGFRAGSFSFLLQSDRTRG